MLHNVASNNIHTLSSAYSVLNTLLCTLATQYKIICKYLNLLMYMYTVGVKTSDAEVVVPVL